VPQICALTKNCPSLRQNRKLSLKLSSEHAWRQTGNFVIVLTMKAAAANVPETVFVSVATFSQKAFKRWVENRPINDANRYELTDGRIVMTPPAGWGHGEIEARTIRILGEFVARHELGKVFGSSTGYDLPSGDTLEPDASFITFERWTKGPQVAPGQFLRIVPSLVVEILSPATAQRDRVEKKRIYEANGVDEYWLVDSARRDVTVFNLIEKKYGPGKRFKLTQNLRSRLLRGLDFPIRLLFA
jgi:Uma2 family endonuclease